MKVVMFLLYNVNIINEIEPHKHTHYIHMPINITHVLSVAISVYVSVQRRQQMALFQDILPS